MGWTLTTVSLVVFGSGVVAALVGLASVRQRPDPLAWPLALTMFAVAAWAIPHAISFGYADLESVVFWTRTRYPGTVLAPIAYFVLTVEYAGYDRWLSRRTYALLAVIPTVTVVLVWTNPHHGLFWQSLSLARVHEASILVEEFGPWYWVNLGYLYLVTGAGLTLLGVVALRSGPLYRKQAGLMFVGGLAPLATNGAMNAGLVPGPAIDFTTTALAATGVTFALALFHFDLLNVRPVARATLIEELDDGVVVVGPNGRVRDYNATAARVLGDLALDQPAEAVLPPDIVPDGGELVVETDEGERWFRTRSTALTDESGREVGRLVYLNDITDIFEREQRLSVLNRVLRHNIRNDLSVVTGRLEMLADQATGEEGEHIRVARENARRVVEIAEKARYAERTLRESDASTTISAASVAERVVTDAQERYSSAVIEYASTTPDGEARVRVVDEELFEMALAELVENAVVHNDRSRPQVTVRVEPAADRVRVSVADDGPGIPNDERRFTTTQIETQLEHGVGLGLWLVRWLASLSRADLTFAENDPRGSVVALEFDAAEE